MHIKFKDSVFFEILKDELEANSIGVEYLPTHFSNTIQFFQKIPKKLSLYAYEKGKWTISELLGHLIDTQIVFLNRILYIARGENVALHPFDERLWVNNCGYKNLSILKLLEIYISGSNHFHHIIQTISKDALIKMGIANNIEISGEEIILYLIAHENHHIKIISKRYLKSE